ncbi:hypothetical protein D6827_00340 [Candidatus Parcubacteria bacterium]|nr:MAG: hypothetical protein D6827_00340 [Candidatus Parcubacteria bacterium]
MGRKRKTTHIYEKPADRLAKVVANAPLKDISNKSKLLREANLRENRYELFTSNSFRRALKEYHIDDEKIASVLKDALDAKQSAWYRGELVTSDEPDHKTRLEAVNKIAELTGLKRTVIESKNLNVNLSPEEILETLGL